MLPPPNRQSRNGKGNPTLAIVIVVAAVILLNAAATVGAYILVLAIPIAIVVAVTAAAVSAAKKQRPAPKPAAKQAPACPNPEPHRHYDLEDDCPNPEPHRHATARYQPPRVPKAPKREYDTFVQPVKNWPTAAERRRENMKHLYEAGLLTREEYQAELQKLKVLEV